MVVTSLLHRCLSLKESRHTVGSFRKTDICLCVCVCASNRQWRRTVCTCRCFFWLDTDWSQAEKWEDEEGDDDEGQLKASEGQVHLHNCPAQSTTLYHTFTLRKNIMHDRDLTNDEIVRVIFSKRQWQLTDLTIQYNTFFWRCCHITALNNRQVSCHCAKDKFTPKWKFSNHLLTPRTFLELHSLGTCFKTFRNNWKKIYKMTP